MRLFGSLVVQNEGDVIEDLLEFLAKLDIYEKIFFFDLGSEDDTFEKAMKYEGLLHEPQVLRVDYTNTLRMRLLMQNHRHFRSGDWVSIIDADEFYVEDPKDLIGFADKAGADSVWTYQAQFQLTDRDLDGLATEDATKPIYERRRHYLINWTELRFFKYLPGRYSGPIASNRPCSRRLLNGHYQFRSPEQIKLRIRTRLENRRRTMEIPKAERWPQIYSEDWRDYTAPHSIFHTNDGGELKFGLPSGVSPDEYRSLNPFETGFVAMGLQREREENLAAPVRALVKAPAASEPATRLRIRKLGVEETRAGTPFNVQPDGTSAIWIECEDASAGTAIVFDWKVLDTICHGPELLTAVVPDELFSRPGYCPVVLARDRERSNVVDFVVKPSSDLEPS